MRITRFAGVVPVAGLLVGCYTLQPTRGGVPDIGTQVTFDVNDAGRVALGGSMGPEIGQIEGKLIEKGNGNYVVAVSAIRLLRGGEQVWSGEPVQLKSEYLGSAYERRFSKSRTVLLGAVTVGGFAAFLATRSLIGSGSESGKMPQDTADLRIVRP
jgi:hypothetical protein